jgi:hypothetical protein
MYITDGSGSTYDGIGDLVANFVCHAPANELGAKVGKNKY